MSSFSCLRVVDLAISTRRNFEKYFKIATDAIPKC